MSHRDQKNASERCNIPDFSLRSQLSTKPKNFVRDDSNFRSNDLPSVGRNISDLASNNNNLSSSTSACSSPSSPNTWKGISRTPRTFPRTKIAPNTSMAQRLAVENLRQHMTFNDAENVSNEHSRRESESEQEQASGGLPDGNQIIGRLMQLQECLGQVTAMIESFESADASPQVQEQVQRLVKVRDQMQNSENQLIALYHKVTLAVREEAVGAVDGRENHVGAAIMPETDSKQSINRNVSEREEILSRGTAVADYNAVAREHDKMQQKLIATQGKLRTIKDQRKLNDNSLARQMKMLREQHQNFTQVNSNFHNGIAENRSLPSYLLRATSGDEDKDNMIPERLNDSSPGKATQLTDDAVIRDGAVGNVQMNGFPMGVSDADVIECEKLRPLDYKLKDLMDKKLHIDKLLSELTLLKEEDVTKEPATNRNTAPQNQVSDASSVANETIAEAQELLQTIDAHEKMNELNSIKQKLSQLKHIVSLYHLQNNDNGVCISPAGNLSGRNSVKSSVCEEPIQMRKDSNISRESLSVRGRRDWSPEGHCSADEDDQNNVDKSAVAAAQPAVTSSNPASCEDADQDSSDNEDDWMNNPDLNLKAQKLQDAKTKLTKLQDLIGLVQDSRDRGILLPVQCMELLKQIEAVEDDEELSDDANKPQSTKDYQWIVNDCINAVSGSNLSEGEVPYGASVNAAAQAMNDESARVVEEYKTKMKEQKHQLDRILDEKKKLLKVQKELVKLRQQVPLNNVNQNKQSMTGSADRVGRQLSRKDSNNMAAIVGNHGADRTSADLQTNFTFHPNIPSAHEQNDVNMPRTTKAHKAIKTQPTSDSMFSPILALREELHRQSEVLEELMREEREKQQTFSQNQDNQSIQSTKSIDAYGNANSERSAEVTALTSAATWGGSTVQENLDDDDDEVDDQNFSQDDPEDDYSEENRGRPHPPAIVEIPPREDYTRINRQECNVSTSNSNANLQNISRQHGGGLDQDSRTNNCNLWIHDNQRDAAAPGVRNRHENCAEISNDDHNVTVSNNPGVGTSAHYIDTSANALNLIWQQQQSARLLQRVEENIQMCQTILREQHSLTSMVQATNLQQAVVSPQPLSSTLASNQELHLNLQQAHHMLYLQQVEIQQLQQQLQQLSRDRDATSNVCQDANVTVPSFVTAANQHPLVLLQPNNPTSSIVPPTFLSSNEGVASMCHHQPSPAISSLFVSGANNSNIVEQSSEAPKTLNNQVPPGTRANNYWDNFRSCSRQNLLSVHKSNGQASVYQHQGSTIPTSFVGPAQSHFVPRHVSRSPIRVDGCSSPIRNLSAPQRSSASFVEPTPASRQRQLTKIVSKDDPLKKSGRKKQKANKDKKPDTKNVCVSNQPSIFSIPKHGVDPYAMINNAPDVRISNVEYGHADRVAYVTSNNNESLQGSGNSNRTKIDLQQTRMVEEWRSRDPIYSEAASFVSENENRPWYLMELFRELKLLNSDYLRQSVLSSLQDLLSKHIPHGNQSSGDKKILPVGHNNQTNSVIDSSITLVDYKPITNDRNQATTTCTKHTAEKQAISIKSNPVSSESRPAASSGGSNVVNPSDGNVDIVDDTSLQEENRRQAVIGSSQKNTGAIQKKRTSTNHHEEQQPTESSSNLPIILLDDKVRQILVIILQSIKSRLDETCLPKLLSNVSKLTLSAIYETCLDVTDHERLPQYFHRQLKQRLQDSLLKFNGLRLRDCYESLLVEISDVLYEDLTFVMLMKQAQISAGGAESKIDNVKSLLQSFEVEGDDNETPTIESNVNRHQTINLNGFFDDSAAVNQESPKSMSRDRQNVMADLGECAERDSKIAGVDSDGESKPEDIDRVEDFVKNYRMYLETEVGDISNKDLAEADQSPRGIETIVNEDDFTEDDLGAVACIQHESDSVDQMPNTVASEIATKPDVVSELIQAEEAPKSDLFQEYVQQNKSGEDGGD